MRNRGHIIDRLYFNSQSAKLTNSRFAADSGTFYIDMYFTEPNLESFLRGGFRYRLSGKRRRFLCAPKVKPAGTCPGNSVTHKVCNRNDSIIERRLNIYVPFIYGLFLFPLLRFFVFLLLAATYHCPPLFLLAGNGLLLAFPGTRIGPGPLTAKGQALSVTQATVTANIHKPLDIQSNFGS